MKMEFSEILVQIWWQAFGFHEDKKFLDNLSVYKYFREDFVHGIN
jgi:hypothetical protein